MNYPEISQMENTFYHYRNIQKQARHRCPEAFYEADLP